jgi:hypothetical protein
MDSKISALNSATVLTDADVLPIVNGAETKKVTVALLRNSAVGGDLQGTLPNPTVHQLQGQSVQSGAPVNNDLWIYDATASMWKHIQMISSIITNALGFTPENVANKQTDLTASATKYPTVNAVNSGLATKQNTITNSDSITQGSTNLFLTTAERTKLTNTTNTNSGDETTATILTKLGYLTNQPKIVVKDAALGSTITGTTAETLTGTYLIPANTFSATDIMRIPSFLCEKTGASGTVTMRVKVGTTATFGSSTLIATYTTGITSLNGFMIRNAITIRSSLLRLIQGTAGFSRSTDLGDASAAIATVAFNPAVDNYIFTSLQLSVSSDSVFQSNFLVTN